MAVDVTLHFDSLSDMVDFFAEARAANQAQEAAIDAGIDDKLGAALLATQDAEPEESNTKEAESVKTSGKRKRRTKAEIEAAKNSAETPEEQENTPASSISKDDIRAKLGDVNKAKGLVEARSILAEFGATSVSGLKETEYRAFVKKCDEKINA